MQAMRRPRMELPVTRPGSDRLIMGNSTSGRNIPTRGSHASRRRRVSSDVIQLVQLLLAIVGVGLTVVVLQRTLVGDSRHTSSQGSMLATDDSVDPHEGPTLSQEFPSLQYALHNSQLVLLYFAASWCPMSTPVTRLIDETLGDLLLPPPPSLTLQGPVPDTSLLPQRHGLSLVYVSSDRTIDEMENYLQDHWMYVPFDTVDKERDRIKRHFSTCAKRELHQLGFDRKHEIPTIIVLDGNTETVLTFDGVAHLKQEGAKAVDRWMDLAKLSAILARRVIDATT